jgi:dihydroorotate dehydrogenase (fumarate)
MNTSTSYLGFALPHPFIAGASPFGWHVDSVKRLEDAGCAAVVLHSLFEEQITMASEGRIHHMDALDAQFSAALSDYPATAAYPLSPDQYAEHIRKVKQATKIPIVASLNGTTAESWLMFARVIEEAGADALELNLYDVVTDLDTQSADVERQLAHVTTELKRALKIPIAVKVSPYFAAFGHVARQLDRSGADGIVMFNRFYQPDIDVRTLMPSPHVELSTSAELLLRLRWIAILYGRLGASLALTGGVARPDDGIKAILAGANAVQMVSALLRHGPAYISVMRQGLERWMDWHKFSTLDEFRGRTSLTGAANRPAFERANYIKALQSWRG